MDLALFDFDGTITTKGTYPGFVRFAVRRRRQVVEGILLVPVIVGYRLGLVSDRIIRKVISHVGFSGDEPGRIRRLGAQYAREVLPDLVRPMALERISWHKARGDRVVVVSASLDDYLRPWCDAQGVDVICTQLEARDGRLTGSYVGGDCCEEEKARRIRERYALADYVTVHGYGDTEEDRQMLELAHARYFCWDWVSTPAALSPIEGRCGGDGQPIHRPEDPS